MTISERLVEPLSLPLSLTVSPMLYVPRVVYVWETVGVVVVSVFGGRRR